MGFLRSPEGARYDEHLLQAFEVLCHTPQGPTKKDAECNAGSAIAVSFKRALRHRVTLRTNNGQLGIDPTADVRRFYSQMRKSR